MIRASAKFINAINDGRVDYSAGVSMTLADGTLLSFDETNIWNNGIKIEGATSSSKDFTIGAFIASRLTLTLNNIDESLSAYDFSEAFISSLSLSLDIDGTTETIHLGKFFVDEPTYNGNLVKLSCTDRARFFNKKFEGATFPITLGNLAKYCVRQCLGDESLLATPTFNHYDYSIASAPENSSLTYADIIACISQMAGSFARFNNDGRLYFSWYGGLVSQSVNLNGGVYDDFTPYQSGDNADGGDYTYAETPSYDGGTYQDLQNYHIINSLKEMNIGTDNFTITKIAVEEYDFSAENRGKGSYALSQKTGSGDTSHDDDYVISITENPLIQKGKATEVAQMIGEVVVGMSFRPMTVTQIYSPLIEPGDIAYVVDRHENGYFTFISSVSSTIGNGTRVSCAGKPSATHNQIAFSDLAKTMSQMKQQFEVTKDFYQQAQEELMSIMAFGNGLYHTEVQQPDGSVIRYDHDESTLANSHTVWKYTAQGKAVTENYTGDDATTVWNTGVTASGNALFNTITAKTITGFEIIGSTFRNASNTFSISQNGNIVGSTIKNASNTFSISPNGEIVGASYRNNDNSFSISQYGKLSTQQFGNIVEIENGKITGYYLDYDEHTGDGGEIYDTYTIDSFTDANGPTGRIKLEDAESGRSITITASKIVIRKDGTVKTLDITGLH